MASAPQHEMPLLCELGWHKADPLARWNAGYYFSTCGRCGHDLVRTAYGGWRVPKGFKVVWQAQPPESLTSVELVPEDARRESPRAEEARREPDRQDQDQDQHELDEQELDRQELDRQEPAEQELDEDSDRDEDRDRNQMELPIQEVLRQLAMEEQPSYPALDEAAEDLPELPPSFASRDHQPLQESAEEVDSPEAGDSRAPAEAAETEVAADPGPEPESLPEPEEDTEPQPEAEAEVGPEPVPPEPEADAEPEPEPEPDPEPEPEPDLSFEAELAAAAAASAAAKVPPVDDFMEDDWFVKDEPGYEDWDRAAEHEIDLAEPEIVDDENEHVGNRSGKMRYGKEVATIAPAPATFLNMLRPSAEEHPEESVIEQEEEAPAAAPPSPNSGALLAVAASIALLVLLIVGIGSGWEIGGGDPAMVSPASEQAVVAQVPQPEPQSPAQPPATDAAVMGFSEPQQTGFVTASLLNCRTAPAEQAESVRILRRGDSVQVLALEPDWASISHRGRQCWASSRYLSAQQPL